MTLKSNHRVELPGTIAGLRICNDLQSEVIANMEHYQVVVERGAQQEEGRSGRSYGYVAELSYLHDRRIALDALIEVMEKYRIVSNGGWTGRAAKAAK